MKLKNVRRRQWRRWEYRRLPNFPKWGGTPNKPYKASMTAHRYWVYKWPGRRTSTWRPGPYRTPYCRCPIDNCKKR